MFFFHLRTRAGFFSKGVGPFWNETADSRMEESSESESDDILQDNTIPETGEEEDGRDLDDIVHALVDEVRGKDDIDMCDLVTDHLRYASLRSRMGLEMRARTFCPPVVRRNVGIVAAGDLDPIDQEDVVSLLTRVEWACETIKGFAESAGKKHKKRGESAAIGPLSSLLIEAFSKYLLDRTVAQVRYHTLGDFIEGCIESVNFPNDYEDMRRALGRLLEKMGIRTVRQLCEHPTVDTEKKRDEMAKMLSNKGRFKEQCKEKEWLSPEEVAVLFPAMKAVLKGWGEAVERTLLSNENLEICRRLLRSKRSPSPSRDGGVGSRGSSVEACANSDSPPRHGPDASADRALQQQSACPPPTTPLASSAQMPPPDLACQGPADHAESQPFPNPLAVGRRGDVAASVLNNSPDGVSYVFGGPRHANSAVEADQHFEPDGASFVSALRRSGVIVPGSDQTLAARFVRDFYSETGVTYALDIVAARAIAATLCLGDCYVEKYVPGTKKRGRLVSIYELDPELPPKSNGEQRVRAHAPEPDESLLPPNTALVILFEHDAMGRPMTAPAVLVPKKFVDRWNSDYALELAHPNEQCICESTCESSCPAQRQPTLTTNATLALPSESTASSASTACMSFQALVAGMLAGVHEGYNGVWISAENIAEALKDWKNPIGAASYLSEQISQEEKRDRAVVVEGEKKRKSDAAGAAAQPAAKKGTRDAAVPLDPFLSEVVHHEEQVLMANVQRAAADLIEAIRRGDSHAFRKFSSDHLTNHLELNGSGAPDKGRLGPWLGLLAACFALGRIFQHFVPGEVVMSSPPSKASTAPGKSPSARSSSTPASPAPVARPRTRAELRAIIETLNTATGYFTLGGKSVGVLPHSSSDWNAINLGSVPSYASFNEVSVSIGLTTAPGVKLTAEHETSAAALRAELIATATPVRIAMYLCSRAYGSREVVVGGKFIGDIENVLTDTRVAHMRKTACSKPPAMLFLSRLVNRFQHLKGSITPPFWQWVKANMMAVFEFLCLPHQRRALELPAMYSTPRLPPCAGQVYHPRPSAPLRQPTPNRDHGRTDPVAKG
jgi:hypothetical protein